MSGITYMAQFCELSGMSKAVYIKIWGEKIEIVHEMMYFAVMVELTYRMVLSVSLGKYPILLQLCYWIVGVPEEASISNTPSCHCSRRYLTLIDSEMMNRLVLIKQKVANAMTELGLWEGNIRGAIMLPVIDICAQLHSSISYAILNKFMICSYKNPRKPWLRSFENCLFSASWLPLSKCLCFRPSAVSADCVIRKGGCTGQIHCCLFYNCSSDTSVEINIKIHVRCKNNIRDWKIH